MGTGSSGMVQSFSEDSAQNVIVVYFTSTKTAGTEWKLPERETERWNLREIRLRSTLP